jgi:hypothetical protein
MEVVLRPSSDFFLQDVVFPALELGVVEAAPALEHLLQAVSDRETQVLLELVLENNPRDSFYAMRDERWNAALYRLLFHEWVSDTDGWVAQAPFAGFASPWEEGFHVGLMLEDTVYPYADDNRADLYRRAFWAQPKKVHGLASFLCGVWDPLPSFPPDQVLTHDGHGQFSPKEGWVRAEWSWRPTLTVNQWAAKLPSALNGLLAREAKRLAPVELPERHEILDYWLGRIEQPPLLAVSFSGLGPRASAWIRDVGQMAQLIRNAAADLRGLTVVLADQRRNREP